MKLRKISGLKIEHSPGSQIYIQQLSPHLQRQLVRQASAYFNPFRAYRFWYDIGNGRIIK